MALLAAFALVGGTAQLEASNGLLLPGYTARGSALGGATTAEPGAGMDLQANPALLVRARASSDEFGLRYARLHTTYTDSFTPPDGHPVANRSETSMQAALPYAGLLRFWSEDTAWGLAAFVQGGGGGSVELDRRVPGGATLATHTGVSELPQSHVLSENLTARMASVRLAFGGATRVGRLSLGASLDTVLGSLRLSTGYALPSTDVRLPGSGFNYRSRTTVGVSGSLGLSYEANDRWSFGAAYFPRVELTPDGDAQVGPGNPANYRRSGVSLEQRWPAVSRAGLAFRAGNWKLLADARYIEWSRAFANMSLVFEDAWVETPLGTKSNVVAFRHQWRDQLVSALGAEWTRGAWAVRFGYNYGRTPLSPNGLNPLFGATTEHHFAAGFGWEPGSVRYDLALEYGVPRTIKGTPTSDWAVAHAVLGADRLYLPFFKYSKRTWTGSVVLGITRSLGRTPI